MDWSVMGKLHLSSLWSGPDGGASCREEQQMRKLRVTMLFFIPGLEPSILCRDHFTIWQFTSCRTNLSQPPVEKGLKEVELNWDLFWFVNLEVVISRTKLHSQPNRDPLQTCWDCWNNNNQQTNSWTQYTAWVLTNCISNIHIPGLTANHIKILTPAISLLSLERRYKCICTVCCQPYLAFCL